MLAENPVLTTSRFVASWRYTHPERLKEEIKSVFNETNRQPDNISFIVKDGELVDPATNKVINFRRQTALEKKEGMVWEELKKWSNRNDKGICAWLSPMLEGVYPCNKVIFYEINYNDEFSKTLSSTTILFDSPKDFCLKIAKNFNPLVVNFRNPEELREILFKLPINFNLNTFIENLSQNKKYLSAPSQELLEYFIDKIKSGENPDLIATEMQLKGLIGKYSISCPVSINEALGMRSTVFNLSSKENWQWKKGDCIVPSPQCGRLNVEVGPCNVCRICQNKFDRGEMSELRKAA